jgi:undecaprenol kinase
MDKEKNILDEVKNTKRFAHAFRGIYIFVKNTRHLLVYLICSFAVLFLGYYYKISNLEWIALILSIGITFALEAINTAIEIDINLTSPEYHPYARDTKDVAAGAVLLFIFFAIVIAGVIFIPKFLGIFG